MILFNGCSFTIGEIRRIRMQSESPYERRDTMLTLNKTYAQFLGEAVDKSIANISMSGKDNLTMINDIISVLRWEECEKLVTNEKIDTIVLQPTDYFRHSLPSSKFKQYHRINSLESQLLFNSNKYTKLMTNSIFMDHMKEYGNADEAFRIESKLENNLDPKFVGDTSQTWMKYEWCQKLMHLQLLCEIKKIKLVIMNYYPIGEDYKKDPLFQAINLDNFIIEDPFKSGMYEHLEQEALTKTEDNFHWEIDAHKYQADILEDFIKNNTKIKVRSNIESRTTKIYDYSTEL